MKKEGKKERKREERERREKDRGWVRCPLKGCLAWIYSGGILARHGGSQCQRNFKYLCYLRGYKIRTFEFHRRPLEIPFAIKWRKVETSFPECKEERKEILRKSDIVVVPLLPFLLFSLSTLPLFSLSSSLRGPFRCSIVPFSSLTPWFRFFSFLSFSRFVSSGRCVWNVVSLKAWIYRLSITNYADHRRRNSL